MSDFFQLEQLANFFTDSYVVTEFAIKNRLKTRKLIEISEDLAIDGTSLKEVEENILNKEVAKLIDQVVLQKKL